MQRIRTIKPSFWDDEIVGMMSRDARLLFIATWNQADDEGLLRWSPAFIKAMVFKFDDDLDVADVEKLMTELTSAGVVFEYVGGKARQRLAYVVNFRKHQKINRPNAGSLPPPPIDSPDVVGMYARRDEYGCWLCHRPVAADGSDVRLDRKVARSRGGTDYPTNVVVAHLACAAPAAPAVPVQGSLLESVPDSGNDSRNRSVNEPQNGNDKKVKAPATEARGTRIPADFTVTPEMVTWARETVPHVDGPTETDNFVDYWRASSGANARKKEWVAAWRVWMRNADKDLGRRTRGTGAGRAQPGQSTTNDRVQQGFEAGQQAAALRETRRGRVA
jgi:hypothetical protein